MLKATNQRVYQDLVYRNEPSAFRYPWGSLALTPYFSFTLPLFVRLRFLNPRSRIVRYGCRCSSLWHSVLSLCLLPGLVCGNTFFFSELGSGRQTSRDSKTTISKGKCYVSNIDILYRLLRWSKNVGQHYFECNKLVINWFYVYVGFFEFLVFTNNLNIFREWSRCNFPWVGNSTT